MKLFYAVLVSSLLLIGCSSDRANSEEVMSQTGEPIPDITLINPNQ